VLLFGLGMLLQVGVTSDFSEALQYLLRSHAIDPAFDNFDRIAAPLFRQFVKATPRSALGHLNIAIMAQSKLYASTSSVCICVVAALMTALHHQRSSHQCALQVCTNRLR
jgi:hypothetical protein